MWGCLGRLTEEKGQSILIEGFRIFLESLPDEESIKQHLFLVGGGSLQDALKKQVSDSSLNDKVTITGKVPRQDVIKHYASFDYFVQPSLAEGFGIVLLEAMTVGVPVIASDLEVFKEVAKDTVTYFKKGDAQDLGKVMLEVTREKSIVDEKKQIAQQRVVDLYSFEKFADCYNSYYLDLMSK